jgi:hypothetical protein
MGHNGIGRVGFTVSGEEAPAPAAVSRETLLNSTVGPQLLAQLVDAYLSVPGRHSGAHI